MIQYRLLEITTSYASYLNYFYDYYKNTELLSYEELYSLFTEDCFAESDFIHRHLKEIGIESKVVFYNNMNLQRKWKDEFANSDPYEIVINQVKDYEPDVIYISDMTVFTRDQLFEIKSYSNSKRVRLVGFCFFLLTDQNVMDSIRLYDQIYTGAQNYVDYYLKQGANAKLLRHAFESPVYDKCNSGCRKKEVVFMGNVFLGKDVHSNRIEMLKTLIESGVSYTFYGDIYGGEGSKTALGRLKDKVYQNRERRNIRYITDKNRQNHYPNVYGREYYKILSEKLVCVNCHIAAVGQGAGNMRMFEATGMGACLLTDSKDENAALFEIDKEIVTYSNMIEFRDKVKWLMDNPDKAQQIAKAGQEKTFRVHSYRNKALRLNEYLQEIL